MGVKEPGKALASTEITPTAPKDTIGKVSISSPEISKKSSGLFLAISIHCTMSPEASLVPAILGCSASFKVVAALRLDPVRPGTLYNNTGTGQASAIAV